MILCDPVDLILFSHVPFLRASPCSSLCDLCVLCGSMIFMSIWSIALPWPILPGRAVLLALCRVVAYKSVFIRSMGTAHQDPMVGRACPTEPGPGGSPGS